MAEISLLSQPYVGFPIIKIKFSRVGGVQTYDYVDLSYNNTRLKWEWCCRIFGSFWPKDSCDFNSPQRLGEYTVQYFGGGGYILPGRQLGEFKFKLQNPVISARTTRAKAGEASFPVFVELRVPEPLLTLALRTDSVRIDSVRLKTSSVSCEERLSCPRVPGLYTVVILGTNDADTTLYTCQLEVYNHSSTSAFSLWLSYDDATLQKVLVVNPNEFFFARANGSLLNRHEDVIIITRADHPKGIPKMTSLALEKKFPLGQPTCISVAEEGLYHVVLGVKHKNTFLIGSQALLLVTSLKETVHMTLPNTLPTEIQEHPTPPLCELQSHPVPTVTPDAGFMCVVCQDRHVQIKIDPCKHVCLCESCWQEMSRRQHSLLCPMCRGKITSHEKLYFA